MGAADASSGALLDKSAITTLPIRDSVLDNQSKSNRVPLAIGPQTRYIISTSGRLTSLRRYRRLLEDILRLDVAYIPFHSGDASNPCVSPVKFANALRSFPCIGGAISRDIKHSIIPYLDELDDTAASVQSVNTVVLRNNGNGMVRLVGYNTDVLGFRKAIEVGMRNSGISVRTAICYGYGGVVSVVVAVLQSLGIEVSITGRRLDEAQRRAQELGCKVWKPQDGMGPVDLFVNAAPVTDHPLDQAPNFLESLAGCSLVFDHEMPGKYLHKHCSANGIHLIPGTDMYYPQMLAQWKLFLEGVFDEPLSESSLQDALHAADSESA